MSLFEICIRRPVLATVLSLLVLVIGAISYTRLDVREYPRIDEPIVSVNTTYPGASADVIESQVTKILEDSLAGIEGVELMTSRSQSERSNIDVRFRITRDPDSAAADVRDKVARVRARLPETVDEPVIAKVEADAFPIIWMAVAAGDRTPLEVSDYLTRYIKPRLSVLPGAADVRIFGERVTSMRINVDRDRLAAYALTSLDVENALRRQNLELPSGRIESAQREFSIVATTDVSTREQFDNLIIANVKGYPVRLRDVADVQVGAVSERVIARYNGKPSINMGLIKQAVANPLDLSHALREELARINPTLAAGNEHQHQLRLVGVHRPLDQVGVQDRRRGGVAGRARDLFLPAQLPRDIDPAGDDSAGAGGLVRADVRVRLHDQHADAARDGAGDRARRRRCDRRARKHLPQHRSRHGARRRRRSRASRRSASRWSR